MNAQIRDYILTNLKTRQKKIAGDQLTCNCIFHSEDTPSLSVKLSTGQYNCFGCGASGGILDLTEKMFGLKRPEAIEKLVSARIYQKREQSGYTALKTQAITKPAKTKEVDAEKDDWVNNLFTFLLADGYISKNYGEFDVFMEVYAKKRGFSKQTIFNSVDCYIISESIEIEIKSLEANKSVIWSKGNFIFVYRNMQGEISTLKYHDADYLNKDEKLNLPIARLENSFFKSIVDENQALVIACEGEMDALALNYLGFNAIAVGSLSRLTLLAKELIQPLGDKLYFFMPDFKFKTEELEARYWQEVVAKDLKAFFINLKDTKTEYKDVCEALILGSSRELREKIARAILGKIADNFSFYLENNYFNAVTLRGNTKFLARMGRDLKEFEAKIDTIKAFRNMLTNYIFGKNALFNKVKETESFNNACEWHFRPFEVKGKNKPSLPSNKIFKDETSYFINTYESGGYFKERFVLPKLAKNFDIKDYMQVFKNEMPQLYDYLCKILNVKINGDEAIQFYLNFVACKWHTPEEKLTNIIILQGDYGSGKGTFANILKALFGKKSFNNSHRYGGDNRFNLDFGNRLFWFLDEVSNGKSSSSEIYYEDLKRDTGSDELTLEGKGREVQVVSNFATPIIASNNIVPVIKIEESDRRLLYFTSRWVTEQGVKAEGLKNYFNTFWQALNVTEMYKFARFINDFTFFDLEMVQTYKSKETIIQAEEMEELQEFFLNFLNNPNAEITRINAIAEENQRGYSQQVVNLPLLGSSKSQQYYCEFIDNKLVINFAYLKKIVEIRMGGGAKGDKYILKKMAEYQIKFAKKRKILDSARHLALQSWYEIDCKPENKQFNFKNSEAMEVHLDGEF